MSLGSSIGGGIDLSYLKRDASPTANQPANGASPAGVNSTTTGEVRVPALVVQADANNLRNLLGASNLAPVLVYFHSDRAAESAGMLAELERLTNEAGGRALLVKINADESPELAQALGVTGLPSLIAVLKGQPAPLFSASVAVAQLKPVFDKVLQVAADNGLNGTLTVDESMPDAEPAAPKLSEAMLEGYRALEAGEFDLAIAAFETELNTNPANAEPKLAIEQAKFLKRLGGIDLDQVLKEQKTQAVEELLVFADATFAAISPQAAFDLLLDRFALEAGAERDVIRTRLLSYFALAGNGDPAVAAARLRLANLLF